MLPLGLDWRHSSSLVVLPLEPAAIPKCDTHPGPFSLSLSLTRSGKPIDHDFHILIWSRLLAIHYDAMNPVESIKQVKKYKWIMHANK